MILTDVLQIGTTPTFIKLPDYLPNNATYIKLEGINIAGSIKLKAAKYMLQQLISEKVIIPGVTKVIESSSGNLGVALSIACKIYGIEFICVIDPNIRPSNEALIRAYGATVIKVTERDSNGGFLGTRIAYINNRLNNEKNIVWTNQYENSDNVLAHYTVTATEIYNEFASVDFLFLGVGTGGTFTGCAKFFREHSPNTKIIAVDALGSVSFGHAPQRRLIPGIGTSKKPPILECDLADDLILVSEPDTIKTCNAIRDRYGLFLGGSSGSVLHAISTYADKIPPNSTVVTISPDMGHAYIDTIYNESWIQEKYYA